MSIADIGTLILKVGLGFIGIGTLAGGIGLLFNMFKKKPRDENNEIITSATNQMEFWKKQHEEEKEIGKIKEEKYTTRVDEITKDFTSQINLLSREVGELKGQLNAEKAQNERLEKIFQNRDPETQKFMEYMVKAMENQDKMLNEIYKLTKSEQDRELKVTSTIVKDGDKV